MSGIGEEARPDRDGRPDAGTDDAAARSGARDAEPVTAWALGFVAWNLVCLVAAQGAMGNLPKALGASFPCGLCGGAWCVHRGVGTLAVHLLGLVGAWLAWARSAARADPAPSRLDRAAWPLALCVGPLVVGATLLETAWVESVIGTGAVMGLVGALLVRPTAPPGARLIGWASLGTALAGYYTVMLGRLNPTDARGPLLVVGLAGVAAAFVTTVVGAVLTRRRA